MNDPHVKSLRYAVHTPATITFEGAPPLETEIDGFQLLLQDDVLIAEPSRHFASEQDARTVLRNILDAWEIDVALEYGQQEIRFVFDSSEVIDRNPPPPGSPIVIQAKSAILVSSAVHATLSVTRADYPSPPRYFRVTPDVATLWYRFEGYKNNHEPLGSAAFACLTKLESMFGDRPEAARKLNLSRGILRTLGSLSTEKGDLLTVRKYPSEGEPVPFSQSEMQWIEAALKHIIRRLGEIDHGPSLPKITLSDLPPLD